MADEKIDIDLDPEKVLRAMEDMGKEVKQLAEKIDQALGKQAKDSFKQFEENAEKGTNKVSSFFRNLGQRVKEDLKTAFDIGALTSGLKIGNNIAEGTKQVFEMERAFDRLNTRLGLTGRQLAEFKKEVGRKVAATGQNLQDVLPGVETAAARGGIKNPLELAQVAETLGRVKATTGEDTEHLADTVVGILRAQGKKVTGQSFKETTDVLQGTRTAGSFKTADEAGAAIAELSKYAKQFRLSARDIGGIAAQASKGGASGMQILDKLFEQASGFGGAARLNATLGAKVFKEGKEGQATGLNAEALSKIDVSNPQIAEAITGLTGASGNDLKLFAEAFKGGNEALKKVVAGANESATQFDAATDNFASKVDRFKEKTKEAGREIGGSLSKLASDILSGRAGSLGADLKDVGKTIYENKGTAAAGLGLGAVGAILAGGGANKLLSKIPGGGLAGGLLAGEAAKAAGIQQVYVVNAREISGGGSGVLGGAASAIGSSGILAKLGAAGAGAAIGVEIGKVLLEIFPKTGTAAGEGAYDALFGGDKNEMSKAESDQYAKSAAAYNQRNGTSMSPEDFAKAVESGTLKAHAAASRAKPTEYLNKSAVTGSGRGM